MRNAPVTTFERIEWLRGHCAEFMLTINDSGYALYASCGGDLDYESVGPFDDLAETIDEALYALMPHL